MLAKLHRGHRLAAPASVVGTAFKDPLLTMIQQLGCSVSDQQREAGASTWYVVISGNTSLTQDGSAQISEIKLCSKKKKKGKGSIKITKHSPWTASAVGNSNHYQLISKAPILHVQIAYIGKSKAVYSAFPSIKPSNSLLISVCTALHSNRTILCGPNLNSKANLFGIVKSSENGWKSVKQTCFSGHDGPESVWKMCVMMVQGCCGRVSALFHLFIYLFILGSVYRFTAALFG